MSRELLKLAFEAIERGVRDGYWNKDTVDVSTRIQKYLAEQPAQQEPVASVRTWHKNGDQHAELDDWGLALALLRDGKHELYTSPPAQRKPLTDKEAKAITYVGPVYAPNGLVTRSPLEYRKELEAHRLDAIRKTEAAHGIKENT